MKKLLFVCVSFLGMSAYVSAQKIEFKQHEINYGTMAYGADGERVFEFTNTGSAPLIITDVQGSCGCISARHPEEPIKPGEKNVIKVKYDTKRVGEFHKSITIQSNSIHASDSGNPNIVLTIKGEVLLESE